MFCTAFRRPFNAFFGRFPAFLPPFHRLLRCLPTDLSLPFVAASLPFHRFPTVYSLPFVALSLPFHRLSTAYSLPFVDLALRVSPRVPRVSGRACDGAAGVPGYDCLCAATNPPAGYDFASAADPLLELSLDVRRASPTFFPEQREMACGSIRQGCIVSSVPRHRRLTAGCAAGGFVQCDRRPLRRRVPRGGCGRSLYGRRRLGLSAERVLGHDLHPAGADGRCASSVHMFCAHVLCVRKLAGALFAPCTLSPSLPLSLLLLHLSAPRRVQPGKCQRDIAPSPDTRRLQHHLRRWLPRQAGRFRSDFKSDVLSNPPPRHLSGCAGVVPPTSKETSRPVSNPPCCHLSDRSRALQSTSLFALSTLSDEPSGHLEHCRALLNLFPHRALQRVL